jgi:hypothetical protein
MLKESVNWDYQWGQIVGRAWADDDFKQRLLADPSGALKEYDLPPPAGLRIEVLENPNRILEDIDGVMRLVLPSKPSAAELSEEDLCSIGGAVAAERCGSGGCHACGHCGGCEACGSCVTCIWCYESTQSDEN